jgi:hypothetical protein
VIKVRANSARVADSVGLFVIVLSGGKVAGFWTTNGVSSSHYIA